mmetsp:Transcript_67683/g.151075  ORF Transcript_67683/g.151075 Transcript_67683/m.151075 type:complete len:131 (-) Transcript_67683:391-783(-)
MQLRCPGWADGKCTANAPEPTQAANAPVATAISTKLEAAFHPSELQVINESASHNVPRGSETHFKVVVVSEAFAELKLLDRHRLVNEALVTELAGPVHALSIVAKTPEQWAKAGGAPLSASPPCLGGGRR